jgi:hypothetical protein
MKKIVSGESGFSPLRTPAQPVKPVLLCIVIIIIIIIIIIWEEHCNRAVL